MRNKPAFTLNGAVAFSVPSRFIDQRSGTKGFTLIELMITIAIIAILASILVPNFGKAKEKASLEACKSNLRNLATAMQMYAADNNGYMCPTLSPANWYTPAYLMNSGHLGKYPICPIGNEYALFQSAGTSSWHGYTAGYIVCCWDGGLAGGGTHPGLTSLMPAIIDGRIVEKDGP